MPPISLLSPGLAPLRMSSETGWRFIDQNKMFAKHKSLSLRRLTKYSNCLPNLTSQSKVSNFHKSKTQLQEFAYNILQSSGSIFCRRHGDFNSSLYFSKLWRLHPTTLPLPPLAGTIFKTDIDKERWKSWVTSVVLWLPSELSDPLVSLFVKDHFWYGQRLTRQHKIVNWYYSLGLSSISHFSKVKQIRTKMCLRSGLDLTLNLGSCMHL